MIMCTTHNSTSRGKIAGVHVRGRRTTVRRNQLRVSRIQYSLDCTVPPNFPLVSSPVLEKPGDRFDELGNRQVLDEEEDLERQQALMNLYNNSHGTGLIW